jgi:indole-3-glycerol phosphate synthase
VLRKDFTVCEADLYDARLMGADAVLLIVAALSDEELQRYVALAGSLLLAALVEVHDLAEAERALSAGAQLIGVNQRDLRTFEVDTARALRVAAGLPADMVKVAESGIRSRDDVARLGDAGYDAVLVGELFVRSPHPADAVRALRALRAPFGVASTSGGAAG